MRKQQIMDILEKKIYHGSKLLKCRFDLKQKL